jgi:hypothetical protein
VSSFDIQNWDPWSALFGLQGEHREVPTPRLQHPPRETSDEWAEISEMAAKSVTGLFTKFIDLASEIWQAGAERHRDGNEDRPFVGDPMEGALRASANLFAYVKQAETERILSATEVDTLNCFAYDSFKLLTRIQQNHKDKR